MNDAGSRQHLVIDARQRKLDVGTLGRALKVEGDGISPVLHPLARLNRVTVFGDAKLSAGALRACAAAGCPVGIADGDGRLRSVLLPLGQKRTTLSDALGRLEQRTGWSGQVEDWQRSRSSRLAKGIARDPAEAARLGWAPAEIIIVSMGMELSKAGKMRLAAEARTFCLGLALLELRDRGCPYQWLGGSALPAKNLVPVFGLIAMWHLVRILRQGKEGSAFAAVISSRQGKDEMGASASRSRAFEITESRLRRSLRRELRMFYTHLLDLTYPSLEGIVHERDMPWPG